MLKVGPKDKDGNLTIPAGLTTPSVGVAGPGHNAWMMTSAALVLFMTLPGLALFYGGLVRRKNVLSVLAQCLGLAGIVTVLWWLCGYSLTFGKGNGIIGGLEYALFRGVDYEPNTAYAGWVSQNVWAIYQLTFAIITPALIIGGIAESVGLPLGAVMRTEVIEILRSRVDAVEQSVAVGVDRRFVDAVDAALNDVRDAVAVGVEVEEVSRSVAVRVHRGRRVVSCFHAIGDVVVVRIEMVELSVAVGVAGGVVVELLHCCFS